MSPYILTIFSQAVFLVLLMATVCAGQGIKRAAGAGGSTATTGSAVQKANGAGGLTAAVAGTDFVAATTGSAVQKANGSGGLSAATAGTDFAASINLMGPSGASSAYWDLASFTPHISGLYGPNGDTCEANGVYAIRGHIPRITFNRILYKVNTAAASGAGIRFGIYSEDKGTLIFDSGAISGTDVTTTGLKTITVTEATIPDGVYFFAWTTSSATMSLSTVPDSFSLNSAGWSTFWWGRNATDSTGAGAAISIPSTLGTLANTFPSGAAHYPGVWLGRF